MVNTIIITGCAKRIGLGLANFYLHTTEHTLIAVVRRASQELNSLKDKYPQRLIIIIKDLNSSFLDPRFFKGIIKNHGEPKALIHCASILLFDEFHTVTAKNFEAQQRLHHDVFQNAIDSYLSVAREASLKTVATFINFGDFKISNNQTIGISYTRSKKLAMNSLKQQAIQGLGLLRVNMVSPGYTLPTEGYDEDFFKIVSNFPFKYTSSVVDICDTVNFLIEQRSITGQHIVVDAGAGLINET